METAFPNKQEFDVSTLNYALIQFSYSVRYSSRQYCNECVRALPEFW
jgi:hypothetical protein